MRCDALKCWNNTDGYCGCSSYITIESNGECDSYYVPLPETTIMDRDTALAVLKELSRDMYPSHDLFGNGTLVVDRDKFEVIRKKYLDNDK